MKSKKISNDQEVIHITTKKTPILHSYALPGHISSVPQIKYLGVHISQDLKWNSHINSTSSKANQTLGFLKQNLRINSSTVKETVYKPLVRPKLEYCSIVWDPICITYPKDGDKTSHRLVDQLEMVQRRAARWVTGRYHNTSSVSDMLRSLDWRSLEQRRVDSRLSMLFKIRHHLVAIDEESWKKRTSIPPVESRQRLYTLLFLFQDSNTVEPTSMSYLPGRVARHLQDSGREDRALKTQLIQRLSSISLCFSIFSIFSSFCLSQFSLFQLIFFILLLYFQSRTPLVEILKAEGIPVYRQSKKKKKKRLDTID